MDAVEFLKERTRMCNFYMSRCMNCPGNKVAYCATLCAKAIALYEEGFGEKRLEKIARRVMELDEEYGDAWTGRAEADYKQEQIDRVLKKAYGKNFTPFFDRNPYIKKFNYAGKGKR